MKHIDHEEILNGVRIKSVTQMLLSEDIQMQIKLYVQMCQ